MTVFYTADLHFGHRSLVERGYRPWASVEEMDAGLVDRWNAIVGTEDTVWVLGDVALSASKLGPATLLNGTKILVCGNHDAPWNGHRKPRQVDRYAAAGFGTIIPAGAFFGETVGGHEVVLSHLPYTGDHTPEERFADRRPFDNGLPVIHGHTHGKFGRVRGRQIDVGVDAWDYTPVPDWMLAELIDQMPAVTR